MYPIRLVLSFIGVAAAFFSGPIFGVICLVLLLADIWKIYRLVKLRVPRNVAFVAIQCGGMILPINGIMYFPLVPWGVGTLVAFMVLVAILIEDFSYNRNEINRFFPFLYP